MITDKRTPDMVFVPACVLCQAYMAPGIVKQDWRGMMRPIVEILVQLDINVVQMPCPESQFGGLSAGLRRRPRGYQHYNTPKFRDHCSKLASQVTASMLDLVEAGYRVRAVLGVEDSPSCAVTQQRTRGGYLSRPGVFMEVLRERMEASHLSVPAIGISRRRIAESCSQVKSTLEDASGPRRAEPAKKAQVGSPRSAEVQSAFRF